MDLLSIRITIIHVYLVGGLCFAACSGFMDSRLPLAQILKTAAEEKAHFHLQELQKSMTYISTLHERLVRTKRSSDHVVQERRKSEFLFDSLVQFCIGIQDFDGSETPTDRTRIDVPYPKNPKHPKTPRKNATTNNSNVRPIQVRGDDYWYTPEIRPLEAFVRVDGEEVEIVFDVKHPLPSTVSRLGIFDVTTRQLSASKSNSLVKSVVDKSSYCEEYYETGNQFVFEKKKSNNDYNNINLKIDVCKYDQYVKENGESGSKTLQETSTSAPLHEKIALPKFRLHLPTESKSSFTVSRGRNESFEIEVQMGFNSYLHLHGVFYDRASKTMVSDDHTYTSYRSDLGPRTEWTRDSRRRLISVEILNSSVYPDTAVGVGGQDNSDAIFGFIEVTRLRVTVLTDSGNLAGKIYVSAVDRPSNGHSSNSIVDEIGVMHELLFAIPKRPHVFPSYDVIMPKGGRFLCDERGNKGHDKMGKNCTLSCWAIGRAQNIISISKADSQVRFFRSMTYHLNDRIETIVDLGTASPDIEGTYECRAFKNKKLIRAEKMQLFTTGFPKVDGQRSTIVDLKNGTSVVTCVVSGSLPMNVTITGRDDSVFGDQTSSGLRLDDDPEAYRYEYPTRNGLFVKVVHVPSPKLKRPDWEVSCQASSERGTDSLRMS